MISDEYFLWGAGTYGARIMEFMKNDIAFKAVIDSDPEKQGSLFHGMPVISYKEAKDDLPGVKIVIAMNIPTKVMQFLYKEGFVKNKDFFVIHSFISQYYWEKDRTLIIKAADIAATTICTMQCEGCATFIPIATSRRHSNAESIKKNIDYLFNHVDRVMNINFCVGESILNKELPSVVNEVYEKYASRYSYLSLQTNGTVIPNDNDLRDYSKANILMVIANYPENIDTTKKLIDKCNEFGINWFYNSQGGSREAWLDYGDPRILYDSDPENLRKLFSQCWQPGLAVHDGYLYMCVQQAWAHLLAEEGTPESGDAFNLRQSKTDTSREELYKIISRQPPERGYISHCMRCKSAMNPMIKYN